MSPEFIKGALAISFFAAPIFTFLPVILSPKSKDPLSGLIWLNMAVATTILTAIQTRVEWSQIEHLEWMFDWIMFPFAAILFVTMLVRGTVHLPKMNPRWLRIIAAITIVWMTAFAFGGIADRIDGDRGLMDLPQYGFEFYVRAIDLFTFGGLSVFYPSVMEECIEFTMTGSLTVMFFNAVMGLFGFTLIIQMAFGISKRRRASSS